MAAASGWWAATWSQKKRKAGSRALLNSAYGQGLNYLLNEESDKATEVLVQMVEVDPDTVELHLALGSLFRRRGETDRAIRVHQNIIARSRLSEDLRVQATLELGRDFFKAGLFDRAEQLFQNLLQRNEYRAAVTRHLLDIYQQEREWQKALDMAVLLKRSEGRAWSPRISHYHCELAELAYGEGDTQGARERAGLALDEDPGCVRATFLLGRMQRDAGDWDAALETYARVEQQDPALLPEVLDVIRDCFEQLGRSADWRAYLDGLQERHPILRASPNGGFGSTAVDADRRQPRYRCDACGFTSRKLFWQCPGCQCWSSVKPIQTGIVE